MNEEQAAREADDPNIFTFDTHTEAVQALDKLRKKIVMFGFATRAEFLLMINSRATFVDEKVGWKSISAASITGAGGKVALRLPITEDIWADEPQSPDIHIQTANPTNEELEQFFRHEISLPYSDALQDAINARAHKSYDPTKKNVFDDGDSAFPDKP